MAERITRVLRKQYGGVPFPSVATPETPGIIKPFSKEARDFLKRKGQPVYPLNGLSLQAQQLAGRPFWGIVDAGDKKLLTMPSMQSEVAFNPSPDKFFLPRSENLSFSQQQEMIDEYSCKLQKEFGSKEIKAVIGDAPDYSLVAFLHLDATGEYLFGAKYNYDCARTKTPTGGSFVAVVGVFDTGFGLHIGSWHADVGYGFVHAAPLVVPA